MRLGHAVVPETVLTGVLVFVTTYLVLFVASAGALVWSGMDIVSGMSATIACLSSVGPGLGTVGPTGNYAGIPALGKLLLSFCMLAGRLEIFALLAIFSPEVWRR
ncbi:MAG: potassium transporter TrkG [Myxococcota bacterium]